MLGLAKAQEPFKAMPVELAHERDAGDSPEEEL